MHPERPAPRNPPMRAAAFVLALRQYGMHDESANDGAVPAAERDCQLQALLKSAASGNSRAFDAFYSATIRHAMSLARRIAGNAYAEDVLADAYFQAWREAERFDAARGSAISWLLTITRSRALDRMRQEALRHAGAAPHGADDDDDGPPCDEPGPPDLL